MATTISGTTITFPDGSTMTTRPGVKSIQTNYVPATGWTGPGSAGEDLYYININVNSVNSAKSYVEVHPVTKPQGVCISGRVISSTQIRISSTSSPIATRWYLIEYY